jgi:N-acetylated-alpha-linked acidic dipeptidase
MRSALACAVALVFALSSLNLVAQSTGPAAGIDARFRALVDAENIGYSMRRLSARPHHVGSPYDKDNAEWLLSKFKEFGWDASMEVFTVLFPTPKERVVELVAPTQFKATLEEPAVPVDPTSNQKAEQLPSFNAYSIDGDVTAPLVYVNYGRPADYEELDRRGISVKGAIVIARYGASWRGIKPKVAAEHGALGCLIYSDPRDDGYFVGDVFPEGPMRNKNGVQRGSVLDMPTYPGDPLTPGIAATAGAKRLDIKDAPTMTKIPVMPISYGDAQPLLVALTGPVAPQDWRGALPITYHIGPGPARVHMKISSNFELKPIYNVIARIQGSTYPEEWVIRGNHHDAWVNGAADPVSGTAPMLEEARALGQLMKQGWRPKRTIVYTMWDGEEPMLLGSTEWVEQHDEELRQKAAIYINSDGNGRGFFGAGGSHSLEKFINDVVRDVQDPETKLTAWKRWQAARIAQGRPEEKTEARSRADLRIGALGSGSDYTPFLQHNGTATLNIGFGGLDDDGIYHSIYDDFYHFTKFLDTDFMYGRALAQVAGTAVIRFADADILPYEFTNLADTVQTYLKEVQALLKQKQDEIKERNRSIEDGVFAAVNDPRHPLQLPKIEEVPPAINFAPLENAANTLARAAERYKKAADTARSQASGTPSAAVRSINAKLIQAERQLTDPAGLPRRPWYRHLLYAPGFYTGYAVKTLPGVREGIEEKKYQEAEAEAVKIAKALEREAAQIDGAAADLERLKN